ncbi:non-ribosomal peptide synthetase [Actinoplanes siamensis]|uniref:Carrier domain-containing protein n=1 Tax=Actinoplanes siamensis TaxID=1223317 RepID=A0A919N9P7_9ACTN|nr:non-ribosomal peptide synthetase [Actinoplanes siamensis]GIF07046.1 hypothetical protein Asi03nite_45840 [Actinoplanes siamensis]
MQFESIDQCFRARVRRDPHAVAVVSGDRRLTYRDLDERAGRLAGRLRDRGLRPGDVAAVLMRRSPDLVVAILAVVRAGGCYLPVHDAYPPPRRQQVLDDAAATILLSDADQDPGELPRVRHVVPVGPGLDDCRPLDEPSPARPHDAAYVMYTSGSEGTPLGVLVSHRGVLGLALDPCWDGGNHDRVLMMAPHAFGVSTYELWVPLLRGGTVVLAPPGVADGPALRRLIERHGVTALHVTAGHFRVLADEAPACFAGAREVLTGGDTISASAVRRVLAACPGLVVRAMYGATEASSFATSWPMTDPPGATVPVGRPLRDVRAYILDDRLRPVGKDVVGDLYLGGGRLAIGYPSRPDLTAQRFLPDPFAGGDARMYRTGDLARWTADGLIDHAGRATEQVKIRGFRVEPAEVENVLGGQPGLSDVVVTAREGTAGERRLVAYVVAAGPVDVDALLARTREHLPSYMVPADVVVLDRLPLTPNGKLDRRALPAPDTGRRAPYRPPVTDRQRVLCDLFAEVLQADAVGLTDSFFDLDGQSLLALRLVGRIRSELLAEVGVADIFDAPTVAELDKLLEARTTAP